MCRADVGFATKPEIARQMIARAIAAKVPFSFVAADSVYGTGGSKPRCARQARAMFWASPPITYSTPGASSRFVAALPRRSRRALPRTPGGACRPGEGTKGPRLHDWAYLELADLDAGEYNSTLAGEWTRGLLIRRNIADGELAFFSTWCPKGTPLEKARAVEGHRWAIEDSFETAKNELGLDHNETRSWHGWHRHVSLVMLAFAMMAVIRHRANAVPPLKKLCRDVRPASVPDPLVDPGNPPHRHEAGTTAHPTRPRHRMVALAPSPPSRRARGALKTKTQL